MGGVNGCGRSLFRRRLDMPTGYGHESYALEERIIRMKNAIKQHVFFGALQLLLMAAGLVCLPDLNYAQDGGNAGQNPSTAKEEKKPLAEESLQITVTVTAEKEPEPALSIPLSITPVTESTIREDDIQAVKQAAAYAPTYSSMNSRQGR
jgi:hypothetical protein